IVRAFDLEPGRETQLISGTDPNCLSAAFDQRGVLMPIVARTRLHPRRLGGCLCRCGGQPPPVDSLARAQHPYDPAGVVDGDCLLDPEPRCTAFTLCNRRTGSCSARLVVEPADPTATERRFALSGIGSV